MSLYHVQKLLYRLNNEPQTRARFAAERDAVLAEHALTEEEIERDAGPGGHEIRSWIVVSAATEGARGEALCFEPIPAYAVTGCIATMTV